MSRYPKVLPGQELVIKNVKIWYRFCLEHLCCCLLISSSLRLTRLLCYGKCNLHGIDGVHGLWK